MQPLPVSDFEFMDTSEFDKDFILNYNKNDKMGYILDVDLTYPKEIHDKHN